MFDGLRIATQDHHTGVFASRQRPLRDQFGGQIVLVIRKPRVHSTSSSKDLPPCAKPWMIAPNARACSRSRHRGPEEDSRDECSIAARVEKPLHATAALDSEPSGIT